jgi:hypothetical protein
MWRHWSIIRRIKLQCVRFARLRGAPDEIAKGVALGIFIGMTPTMGLQMPLAILFAYLLRENRLAAALGVWVTNPLTAPFIYALEYETGRLLLGLGRVGFPDELSLAALASLGMKVLAPLCLGSLVYGTLCAALAYALTLWLIPMVRTWRVPRWPRPRRRR